MSNASDRFRQRKQSYAQAIKEAVAPTAKPISHKIAIYALTVCLIGTMLPTQLVMTFFCLGSVTIMALFLPLIMTRRLIISKRMSTALLALTVMSVLSGCSPAFTAGPTPEMINLARDNNYQVYTWRKISILGIGADQATIEYAQAQSTIKKVYVAQIVRGQGLISIATVTIAGKA